MRASLGARLRSVARWSARRPPAEPTASPPRRSAVWLWLALMAIAAVVAVRAHYSADLSAFLPSSPTPEQAALLDQLTNGSAGRLVLIGIEGGDAATRADASLRLGRALRAGTTFDSVDNGDTTAWVASGQFLFAHRYLLSPSVNAERFSIDGLRSAIDDTVSMLGTPAGAFVKPVLFRDPTGETARMAEAMLPERAPRSIGGVWASRSAPRAVVVAVTHAEGSDLDGQQQALDSVHTAFASLGVPGLHLRLSGPGTFGVESRRQIKAEVERLAIAGSVLMVALLLLAFGTPRALGIAVLPVASGVLAGIAAVSLGFGDVHGMTLGFGTTLIGEAVDYAIYYLIQAHVGGDGAKGIGSKDVGSKDGGSMHTETTDIGSAGEARAGRSSSRTVGRVAAEATGAAHWLRASWPTVRLGLFTSLCGFAALVFSGFPGLAQLGVFSVAGLAAAAATTRFVFPVLAPNGAPGTAMRRRLGRFTERAARALPKGRIAFACLALAAIGVLAWMPSPWRGQLSGLSPVSAADLALDAELRADVGAPDGGTLVALSAASEPAVLELAEAAGARLDGLVDSGVLRGYDSPARLLPSARTQASRRAALPDAVTLKARLDAATADGPIPAARLAPFLVDVAAARTQPLLDRAAIAGTPLAAAVDAFMIAGRGDRPWRALLNLHAPSNGIDTARVRATLAGLPGVQVVDIRRELDALYAGYLQRAAWQATLGAVAVCVLLGLYLRNAKRLMQVAQPIAAAVLIVLAGLSLAGVALGILHLVGLLLVVAIGSNYALFFDQLRHAGPRRTDRHDTVHDDAVRDDAVHEDPMRDDPMHDELVRHEQVRDNPVRDAQTSDNPANPSRHRVDSSGVNRSVDHDTLASLLLANLTAVMSFSLLAFSNIPVLQAIGVVVAPGTFACLVLSAAFIGRADGASKRGRPYGKISTR